MTEMFSLLAYTHCEKNSIVETKDDSGRFVSSVRYYVQKLNSMMRQHSAGRYSMLAAVFSKIPGAWNSFGISDSYIILCYNNSQ